ncbi:MAG: peptidoglycan-binding protein LysM, partial [Flavobacteriaceae bacterium]|nr:peptidoglycan-binding protein LysM [Flavobacteriaceae bacterium]
MKKRIILIALSVIILSAFTKAQFNSTPIKKVQYNLPKANAIVTVCMDIKPFEFIYTPTIDNTFIGFREAVAFKESQGKYNKINSLGYLGKYQFGKTTLNRIKIYDTNKFLNTPE